METGTQPSRKAQVPPPLDPPGSPNVTVHGEDEFGREFIPGGMGYYSPSAQIFTLSPQFLGRYNEDFFNEPTPVELAQMSRDPKVSKCFQIIRNGVLTDDLQFAPGATEAEAGSKANYQKFVDVMQFCERLISGLETPYWTVLEMMLHGALEQGHKIGEVIYEWRMDKPARQLSSTNTTKTRGTPRGGGFWDKVLGREKAQDTPDPEDDTPEEAPNRFARRGTLRLMPRAIKVKPHGTALFVGDQFTNILGIVPAAMGQQSWTTADVISRDKFIVLTINPQDSDPRGVSAWRPGFNYYKLATHIPKNYLKCLMQEGMPIPVLELPDKTEGWYKAKDLRGKDIIDPVTKQPKLVTAAEAGEKLLENMYLGRGVSIPHGSKLRPYREHTANVGQVFESAIKSVYGVVEESILLQPLAQSASDIQGKSAAVVHADVKSDALFWYKRSLAVMTLYDLCAVGVKTNLGDWAIPYMPKLSLGDSEKRDWVEVLEALAKAFWYGFIDETQRVELMSWLGMPRPGDPGTIAKAQKDANGEPVPPAGQRPDKTNKGRQQPPDNSGDGGGASLDDYDARMGELLRRVLSDVQAYELGGASVGHSPFRRASFVAYRSGYIAA